jgi:hypothetical protein
VRGPAAVVCVGLVALQVAVGTTALPAHGADGRELCGVERCTVKTLQDRPRLIPAEPPRGDAIDSQVSGRRGCRLGLPGPGALGRELRSRRIGGGLARYPARDCPDAEREP